MLSRRLRNKTFWLAVIPAILLLIEQIAGLFGVNFDTRELSGKISAIVVSVFSILALFGVTAQDAAGKDGEK